MLASNELERPPKFIEQHAYGTEKGRNIIKIISLEFPGKVVSNMSPPTLAFYLSMGPEKWLESESSSPSKPAGRF